jgi:hypothetical protein
VPRACNQATPPYVAKVVKVNRHEAHRVGLHGGVDDGWNENGLLVVGEMRDQWNAVRHLS